MSVIEILVNHGADKDPSRNTGATPLLMAAQEDHTEVACDVFRNSRAIPPSFLICDALKLVALNQISATTT